LDICIFPLVEYSGTSCQNVSEQNCDKLKYSIFSESQKRDIKVWQNQSVSQFLQAGWWIAFLPQPSQQSPST